MDPFLRSISHPDVSCAGDLAAPVVDPGDPLPLGCKSALPAGAHVGDTLARELSAPEGAAAAPRSFDLGLPLHCVSLGRRDGLIQWPDRSGGLAGRVLTGRPGAWVKEAVCWGTWLSLLWEAQGIPAIQWKRTGRAI